MSKKTNRFDYPHPLIKNLYQAKSYTPQNLAEFVKQKPTFYDTNYTFSPSIKTQISSKLLRLSNTKIVPDEKFGILMQPFCQSQEVQIIGRSKIDQKNWRCKTCSAFLNYQCESVSLYEVRCIVCKNLQSISLDVKNNLENVPCCYDISTEELESIPKSTQKNVCFVIEASEFNHNFRVAQVIQSCLTSLKSTLPSDDLQRKFSEAATEAEIGSCSENDEIYASDHNDQVRYNVAFIMYNDRNIFVINQSTQDVMVFNQTFLSSSETSNQSVIKFEDFFKPVESIQQETFNLVSQILYESYLKNTACLDVTTKFIHSWIDKYFSRSSQDKNGTGLNQNAKRQVQYKFFVNTLKFTKSQFSQISEKQSDSQELFSNVTNMIPSNLLNSKTQNKKSSTKSQTDASQEQNPSSLLLQPNFSFFYLPHYHTTTFNSISQKQVIRKLNNNLYKTYPQTQDRTPKSQMDLFNQLYYDLYENLSNRNYLNVKVNIICSERVEILGIGNQALGYQDCSSEFVKTHSVSKDGKPFKSYSVTMNSIDATNVLPVDLKILPSQNLKTKKELQAQTQHFVQIHLEYTKPYSLYDDEPYTQTFQRVFHVQVTSLNRAINYQQHIYASLSTYVDDETLFYFKLRWILSECHKSKTNHTISNKLYNEMEKLSENFKNEYGQMDFHKEYVRIFLYAWMITKKPIINGINENFYFDRHAWLKGSPQCIAKSLYPRTYDIVDNKETGRVQLKNIKSSPKNFKSDALLLLDNGKFLYFIIGEDNSVQDLKKIFGTCFIDEIRQMTELPELETNEAYREAIDLARSYHESNFLPLKIMELFSRQFDDEISQLLYLKDSHYKFMRQLWEMDPVPKKMRS